MRERRSPGLPLAAAALLLCSYAASGQTVRPGGVDFRLVREHFIAVPVFVDGRGPFDFLLDTGTDSTMITTELAGRLGVRPTGRVSLMTVAGSRAVPLARLRGVTLGSASAGDVEVLVDDLAEVRALDPHIQGILGQNFLSRFNYLLDYRGRRLEFEGAGGPWAGARVPFEAAAGGLIVLACEGPGGAARQPRLLLDSAASGLVVFDEPGREPRLRYEAADGARVTAATAAGRGSGHLARLGTLSVGGETLRDLTIAVLGGEGAVGRAEDGLLPTRLFRAIYFNHAENYLILNPRAAK